MGTVDTIFTNIDEQDIEKAKLLVKLRPPGITARNKSGCECWRCSWSPDGSYVAWSCGRGLLKVIPWNKAKNCLLTDDDKDKKGNPLAQSKVIRTFDAGELIYSVAFGSKSGHGREFKDKPAWYRYKATDDLIVAAGLKSGRIRTWNVRTGEVFLVLMDHIRPVQDLKFAPDGSLRMLSASQDGSVKLWHLDDDGNMSHTFRGQLSQNMNACAWDPDCRTVCGVGDSRGVYLWDVETKTQRQLRGHVNHVCSCSFSPDGALLATASHDTSVIIWNPHTGEQICKLYHLYPPPKEWMVGGANNNYVRYLSFSSNGRNISTVCDDGSLRIWDLLNPIIPHQIADVQDALGCAFSPDGAAVAVGTRDGILSVYAAPKDCSSLQHICRAALQRHLVSMDLSEDEKEVVFAAVPGPLRTFLKYFDMTIKQN